MNSARLSTIPAPPAEIRLDHMLIDTDHGRCVELLAALADVSDSDFPTLFARFVDHTVAHFEKEEMLMSESLFPFAKEHCAEHDRVRRQFDQFQERVDRGELYLPRALVKETLPRWLTMHVLTMDNDLVRHMRSYSDTDRPSAEFLRPMRTAG